MLFVTVQTLLMGLKLQVNVTAHQQLQVLAELAKNKDAVIKSVSALGCSGEETDVSPDATAAGKYSSII